MKTNDYSKLIGKTISSVEDREDDGDATEQVVISLTDGSTATFIAGSSSGYGVMEYRQENGTHYDFKNGDIVVIKDGVLGAGKELKALGPAVFLEQWWVPVEDPEEEDPTLFKAQYLKRK